MEWLLRSPQNVTNDTVRGHNFPRMRCLNCCCRKEELTGSLHAGGSKYKPGTATNLVMGWIIQSNQAMNHQSGTFQVWAVLTTKSSPTATDFESGDVSRGCCRHWFSPEPENWREGSGRAPGTEFSPYLQRVSFSHIFGRFVGRQDCLSAVRDRVCNTLTGSYIPRTCARRKAEAWDPWIQP
jgi:hypothetical protein